MLQLSNMGLLSALGFDEEHCSFRLAQPVLRRYLGDAGVWLELYLYRAMDRSGLFEETATSTVVCWDDDDNPSNNVENEIDVIGLCGAGQLFISCKLSPDTAALNEIATITENTGWDSATATGTVRWDAEEADYPGFYFGSNDGTLYTSQTAEQQAIQRSYHWLFDYTRECFLGGCSIMEYEVMRNDGYWTSSAVSDRAEYAWVVERSGRLLPTTVRSSLI